MSFNLFFFFSSSYTVYVCGKCSGVQIFQGRFLRDIKGVVVSTAGVFSTSFL